MNEVAKFKRALASIEGIYYRRDRGLTTGRNATASDATLGARVREAGDLVAQYDAVTDALDASATLARRWSDIERRWHGLT